MKDGKITRALGHIDDELIMSAVTESDLEGKNQPWHTERKKSMKNGLWKKWIAVAAAFAIIISAGLAMGLFSGGSNTIVALDVNPSLELEINKNEEIVSISALNEDARIVIGDMELEGVSLDVAMNAIVGSMLKNGYLSVDQNSILISVNSDKASTEKGLLEKLSNEVNTMLSNSNIEASVITQSFNDDKATESKAEENKISRAKASLITKIVDAGLLDANGVPYTYESLAKLRVNELKLMLESKSVTPAGTTSSGVASGTLYINKSEAMSIVLEKAGVSESDIIRPEAELDFDDDIMALVWEIEFISGEMKYEYELSAKTGDILEEEVKPKKSHDENDDNITAPENAITREAALTAAYADAGVKADEVKRPEIEIDVERGIYVYEIEFKAGGMEYEYTVNALTGEILERESEKDD